MFPCRSKSLLDTAKARPRGVAVAVVMLLLLLIIGMTAATGLSTRQSFTNARQKEQRLVAKYAVTAGLQTAAKHLSEDPAWNPTEASPHIEFLDPPQKVGFQVWIDAVNRDSTIPSTTTDGVSLSAGQAQIRVAPIVQGETLTGAIGGLESRIYFARPEIEFQHALFRIASSGGFSLFADDGAVLSYDSANGILPLANPLAYNSGTPVPMQHRNGSIRNFSSIQLEDTDVWGDAILPTGKNVNANGNYVERVDYLDESLIPRLVTPPDGWEETPNSPTPPIVGGVMTLAPGKYGNITLGANTTLRLQRDAVYAIEGDLILGDDGVVELTGPATGPCVVYLHDFTTGEDCQINLPTVGAPPLPADFQVYGLPEVRCAQPDIILGERTEAALCAWLTNGIVDLGDDTIVYGSLAANVWRMGNRVVAHYDEALAAVDIEVKTDWVVVSQGLR